MIPPPTDAALIHEHAYQDTGDLSYVLHLDTFTDAGGYKPILKYGLGFFNYHLAHDDEIYEKSWLEMLHFHIRERFLFYAFIFLILGLVWSIILMIQVNHAGQFAFGKKKTLKKQEDLEFHHIKV
ncbi:hypothetical protein ZYGR_0W00310 [Zygosaccharomyces rouxii]|uniref:ZYRO0F16896p n=2 Tax=Zygosaccharomyces rouxii TaxID=4956 RepID=C5DYZ2_ZYGRC|nr:uncharacterized protein ZYRO0F16896g [Zygosaccharomyces rouxii]KAH9201285.1 hypothetical protein LQ764DRAFT_77787 [Zygosaccharomyces rouxii]GAV50505.1 hypothetical protein ZYGR_0W00310 [Zygosaccharomyces rouxii]CAQ43371.1 Uncharacterized protein YCR043C [Zygosaccharomyces rouxii]CAR29003.1 ZYRO0F16896p [Zygosaccharomyces rouxii]